MGRERSSSFAGINESQASGILSDILRESNVYLGGSSIGKGLRHAASYYLDNRRKVGAKNTLFDLPGAAALTEQAKQLPAEEAFYVIDIGIVVSQVYQWRRFFPRIEPFYAVKCNPDPVIVKTLAVLGCNFDCASRNEIRLVEKVCEDLPRQPEIIFANPTKAPAHVIEAVCKGVRMMTFDNVAEVKKCAAISKSIELVLRIITDDRGSQCRLSSKFGAPRTRWRPLLQAAKKYGMKVIGVSFHVGSGCRDAARYEAALRDAREIFDMAEAEFGMKMTLLDIGGGFPGETHSLWNPSTEIAPPPVLEEDEDEDKDEGRISDAEDEDEDRFMFFTEIAEQVAPVIDRLFPEETGVRIIGEPGRYLVAACATLCCSVLSTRSNEVDNNFEPEAINDQEVSSQLRDMSREDEYELVRQRGLSMGPGDTDGVLATIQEELSDYSKLYATQMLVQQEVDVYTDPMDFYHEPYESVMDLLGPPEEKDLTKMFHTAEGLNYPLIASTGSYDENEPQQSSALLTLAAAGEAAVNGVVMQAVADSAPLQDDYAYYINDGVYGAFNNIMFDHASVRPRVLRQSEYVLTSDEDGNHMLEAFAKHASDEGENFGQHRLFASTVFGPTCDSIDVIARSVLLPKMTVGQWLYFNNMGAYTMAAASAFNGFTPSEKFYVCSMQPEYFEALIAGPEAEEDRAAAAQKVKDQEGEDEEAEEKKDETADHPLRRVDEEEEPL